MVHDTVASLPDCSQSGILSGAPYDRQHHGGHDPLIPACMLSIGPDHRREWKRAIMHSFFMMDHHLGRMMHSFPWQSALNQYRSCGRIDRGNRPRIPLISIVNPGSTHSSRGDQNQTPKRTAFVRNTTPREGLAPAS